MGAPESRSAPALVVGSDSRIAIAIARCLGRHGVTVDIAFPRSMVCRSAHIRRKHSLSSLEDAPALASELQQLIELHGYDAVFPTNDLALAALSRHREELGGARRIGCPSADSVASVLSKEKTLEAATALGIDVPRTQLGEELGGPADLRLSYPLIAKPLSKALRSSVKVLYIRDEQAFTCFLADWRGAVHHFLLQQYAPGVGVGVELLIRDGRTLAVFQHQREEELPATGGVSVLARAVRPNERLVQVSEQLLGRLGWDGIAMVEYRYEPETGSATLMEVNGRYWGSLALSDAAGLEFPWYQWQLMHGIDPEVPPAFRVGTRIAWTAGRFDRLVKYMVHPSPRWLYPSSRWRELLSFLRYLPPFTTDAVWRLNDPLAPLSEMEYVARRMLKSAPAGLTKFKKLPAGAKLEYLKLRAGPGTVGTPPPDGVRSILIVCQGNIIRSAFAEALLRRELETPGIRVVSCGTHASEAGADPTAIECARLFDVDLSEHRPRKLTREMMNEADLVLVMDRFNLAYVRNAFPEHRDRTRLFATSGRAKVIKDPYGADWKTFRQCFETIRAQAAGIKSRLLERA